MSEDVLIKLVREVADAYRDGVAEGRRQREQELEDAFELIAELRAELGRRGRRAS